MPRRLVVSAKEINARRARRWEIHYQRRQAALQLVTLGWNAKSIIETLTQYLPRPVLSIEADFSDAPITERQHSRISVAHLLGWGPDQIDLMCVWYWSENKWMEFVHEFNNLPEVTEHHYYTYIAETDQVVLVPMSTKAARRYKSGTSQVQPSTSGVVVPEFEPISRISAPRKGVVPRRA